MSQNNPLSAILDKQDFLLLDGAMATELEAVSYTHLTLPTTERV